MNHILFNDTRGFTLVELIVGLFVAMLLIGAATTAFILQNRASSVQQGTSDMQLSAQVAIELLERDIRMAGFGIDRDTAISVDTVYPAAAAIPAPVTVANTDGLFVNYNTGTAAPYFYYIAPGAMGGLTRLDTVTGAVETIASNVEDLQVTINNDPATGLPVVTVSLLIRSPFNDPSFNQDHPGITVAEHPGIGASVNPAADNFRRRVYVTTVRPRNIGL